MEPTRKRKRAPKEVTEALDRLVTVKGLPLGLKHIAESMKGLDEDGAALEGLLGLALAFKREEFPSDILVAVAEKYLPVPHWRLLEKRDSISISYYPTEVDVGDDSVAGLVRWGDDLIVCSKNGMLTHHKFDRSSNEFWIENFTRVLDPDDEVFDFFRGGESLFAVSDDLLWRLPCDGDLEQVVQDADAKLEQLTVVRKPPALRGSVALGDELIYATSDYVAFRNVRTRQRGVLFVSRAWGDQREPKGPPRPDTPRILCFFAWSTHIVVCQDDGAFYHLVEAAEKGGARYAIEAAEEGDAKYATFRSGLVWNDDLLFLADSMASVYAWSPSTPHSMTWVAKIDHEATAFCRWGDVLAIGDRAGNVKAFRFDHDKELENSLTEIESVRPVQVGGAVRFLSVYDTKLLVAPESGDVQVWE